MNSKILNLSIAACNRLAAISKENNTKYILFHIKGGGCNGFNYVFKPTNQPPDKLDEIIKRPGYELIICNNSLMHVLGTNVDWKKTIMGEAFHFENPMASAKCGCGTSFTSKAF